MCSATYAVVNVSHFRQTMNESDFGLIVLSSLCWVTECWELELLSVAYVTQWLPVLFPIIPKLARITWYKWSVQWSAKWLWVRLTNNFSMQPQVFTEFGNWSISYLSPNIWNSLPLEIKTLHGGAENDGHEIAGHEIDGPSCRAWNCRTWKWRTK